ncbi:MAG TPA: DUF1569 domain-containing protein [Bacteroidia bacterium]|nr:DUF1569 domain-containing protein [Bacteroidia bacterium]
MEFDDFRDIDFDRLSQLPPDLKPLWGIMTLQHMIEHLGDNFRISNGTLQSQVYTPAEKVEQLKRVSLLSDREFPKGITSPLVPGEPLPYRTAGVKEAIISLAEEMVRFEQHFAGRNGHTENHPVFGPLIYNEWILYQNKHFRHHFKQFGLV